jgi:hypothetical protein
MRRLNNNTVNQIVYGTLVTLRVITSLLVKSFIVLTLYKLVYTTLNIVSTPKFHYT